jgi:hypothetical protein
VGGAGWIAWPFPCSRTVLQLFASSTRLLLLPIGAKRVLLGGLRQLAARLDLVDNGHGDHDDNEGEREEDQHVPVEGLDLLRLVAECEPVAGCEDGAEPPEVVASHEHHGDDSELAQRQDAAEGDGDEKTEKVSTKHAVLLKVSETAKGRLHI